MSRYYDSSSFDKNDTIGTLVAFQALSLRFERIFKMKLPLIVDDDIKGAIRKCKGLSPHDDNSLYPFAYVRLTSTGLKSDSHVAKLIAAFGSGSSNDPNKTNTFSTQHFVFWSESSFEFVAEFQDYAQYINFADKLSIVLATKKLSTGVSVSGENFSVIISGEAQIPLAPGTTEDEASPSIFKINHTIQAYSHIGVLKDVPKINNEGKIETNVSTSIGESP